MPKQASQNNRFKNQQFTPTTKKAMTAERYNKAKINAGIVPVAIGDLVQYIALDKKRSFYEVVNLRMVDEFFYIPQLQKIGSNGLRSSNVFEVEMTKIQRYWLQRNDMVRFTKSVAGVSGQLYVELIYQDRDMEIVVELVDNGGKTYICNEEDLKYIFLEV